MRLMKRTYLSAAFAATTAFAFSGCVSEYGFMASDESGSNNEEVEVVVTSVSPSPSPSPTPTPTPSPSSEPPVASASATDSVHIPSLASSKVDLLFVVDNSGSMSDKQTTLANAFSNFIDEFTKRDVNFRIGVITTDVKPNSATYKWKNKLPSGFVNPTDGCLLSNYASEPFLSSESSNLVEKFKKNVKVGTSGSGDEQGIQSAINALSTPKINGCNDGFVRSDALLSLIFVGDEDSNVYGAPAGSATEKAIYHVNLLLDALRNVKGVYNGSLDRIRVDYVVDTEASAPSSFSLPTSTATVHRYPFVFNRAAEMTQSVPINVNSDFSGPLANIGAGIAAQATGSLHLTHTPLAGTLVVKLVGSDGSEEVIPLDSNNGYVLTSDNTVELKGSSLQKAPGKDLVANYNY